MCYGDRTGTVICFIGNDSNIRCWYISNTCNCYRCRITCCWWYQVLYSYCLIDRYIIAACIGYPVCSCNNDRTCTTLCSTSTRNSADLGTVICFIGNDSNIRYWYISNTCNCYRCRITCCWWYQVLYSYCLSDRYIIAACIGYPVCSCNNDRTCST